MVYNNGLKGAEFAIYNYLRQADLSRPISTYTIANYTSYTPQTVASVLARLEEYELITRQRPGHGLAYKISLRKHQ